MAKEQRQLESELYSCRYLEHSNWVRDSRVSGRFIVVIGFAGNAKFLLNGKSYEVDEHRFIILHPHVQFQIVHMSSDFRACCIGSMIELQSSITYNIPTTFLALVLQHPQWEMDNETALAARAFCTLFDFHCNHVRGVNATNIAASLLSIFIQTFYEKTKHLLPSEEEESVSVITRNLVTRFMNELRQHYKHGHQVSYYAERLFVSPKYLTLVVKRSMGIKPKEIIDRKLAIESMFLLSKSNMSIQEISNELGFPDQSYFGRFFKRLLGLSPLAFRNNPDLSLMSRLKPIGKDHGWDLFSKQTVDKV